MDDVIAKVELPRRRFTWEEYHRMGETGVLGPEDRVELIEGEIIVMTPIGLRHAACLAELTRRLVPSIGDRALLWPQNPVRLPRDTEPQPDIVLLRPRADRYTTGSARPEDVLLLVEIADTSYRYDRRVKLPLYARAGVAEMWIVDLAHDVVELYREPSETGYVRSSRVAPGGRVAPAALPDVVLDVDDAFLAR
jgi:Uma2 family endonuclease